MPQNTTTVHIQSIHHDMNLPNCHQAVSFSQVINNKFYDFPKFSGNVEDWRIFKANFNDSSQLYQYNATQNQKALFDPPRDAVKSMLIFPNVVGNLMEELEFRFGTGITGEGTN